jgi:hypothetical protein
VATVAHRIEGCHVGRFTNRAGQLKSSGLPTTMRMVVRPSRCLQRTAAAPFDLLARISIRRRRNGKDHACGVSNRGLSIDPDAVQDVVPSKDGFASCGLRSLRWCAHRAVSECEQPPHGRLESAVARARVSGLRPQFDSTPVRDQGTAGRIRMRGRRVRGPLATSRFTARSAHFGREVAARATHLYRRDAVFPAPRSAAYQLRCAE